MPDLPNFDGAPPEALDLWAWYHIVCSIGCVLWIAAYVAFALKAARDRVPAIPTIAMCLNFAWEASYLVMPNFNAWWPALNLGWLGLDCVLMWQLLRYGPAMQRHPLLARTYRYWVPALVLFAAWGQLSFAITYRDRLALVEAFFINLVMSALFIWTFFERPDQRGLSLVGAWLKLLGTLGTSIGAHVFVPLMNPEVKHWHYLTFVCATILLLDLIYVGLLHHARWERRHRGKEAPPPFANRVPDDLGAGCGPAPGRAGRRVVHGVEDGRHHRRAALPPIRGPSRWAPSRGRPARESKAFILERVPTAPGDEGVHLGEVPTPLRG